VTAVPALRWGILGTANIARAAFLPALRAAGGQAAAVAGRQLATAERFAAAHGVDRAVAGYQALIEDQDIDAVYIPLPNALHAQWTISALRAGKPVLCEKPLCGTLADTQRVLAVAQETGTLLWDAFVFPFSEQLRRVGELVSGGAIGDLTEIQSGFHFHLGRADDIRMSADLQGGALLDVGCYPVRLALEFFGPEYTSAWAASEMGGQGVDVQTWGTLGYPGGRRLLLSCGMYRGYDTWSRLLGTSGQIHLSNPFHGGPDDQVTVWPVGGEPTSFAANPAGEPSFTAAIRHISAAVAGAQQPRSLAVDVSLPVARALHDLAAAAGGAAAASGA
jgi:predicted dehydrogenase